MDGFSVGRRNRTLERLAPFPGIPEEESCGFGKIVVVQQGAGGDFSAGISPRLVQ